MQATGPKRRPWRLAGRKLWRVAVALLALLGGAGAAAWMMRPPPPPPKKEPPPPPVIHVAGQPLSLEGDAIADALDLVRRFARQPVTIELPGDKTYEVVPARLGAEIDRLRLAELVKAGTNETSELYRAYVERKKSDPKAVIDVPIPIRIDAQKAVELVIGLKDDVDRPASDAQVDLVKKKLIPEAYGFHLDAYGTVAALEGALRRGRSEVEAVGERVKPRLLAAQLGNVKFDRVLGWFETPYDRRKKYEERTYNLRLAASKLDGTVLMPGEEFDFNGTVGPRDEANGYKVAPVIAQGELVDGIGGGTCQVSGTLHAAAFFAGLEITERVPHTRPSSYIYLGLDAAVSYPALNFKLRNDYDFPIVLHETVKDGRMRAEILGPEQSRTVTFFRRIDEILPFEVEERETDDVPKGKRVLTQRGVPGFKATVFRITRDGPYAERTKVHNHYPPTTQIVKVGTGPKDAKAGRPSTGQEYTLDEYLVLTQGPDIKKPKSNEPSMVIDREAGRTGSLGWQEREGMPVFEEKKDEDDEDS